LRSMTGFGRAEAEENGRKVTVEIKAVNHRFLDVTFRMPRALSFAEESMRKAVRERLSRGKVDVYVGYSAIADGAKTASADIALIRSYVDAARAAAALTDIADDLKLSDILSIPDAIMIEEEKGGEGLLTNLCSKALQGALDALEEMREREGAELYNDITACLADLEAQAALIGARKESVPKEYAEKLRLRIRELTEGSGLDEARFNAEVAYMADRMDISEEVVRLATHINQFRAAAGARDAVGRKLDFMVQEMNRELNTIGSKSADMAITNAVIEGKSIVEKIREQVQNIE